MTQATLAQLARLVDGQLTGNADLILSGAAVLCDARPGEITLVDGNGKNQRLDDCPAAAVLAPKTFQPEGMPAIQVDDVHDAFAKIVRHFQPPRASRRTGISPLAVIAPTATLADDVDVHPMATIGDDVVIGRGSTIHSGVHIMAGSRIGDEVTIFPGAVLYEDTIVGSRTIIHGGAVLGAFGFGYSQVEGRHELSAQLGNVVVGDDVEIGANTTVDRGTYGPTIIDDGTKIDDQVMVAHNCRLGKHNMICSQVGIAGSTTTGDYVVMAGQVGVRDHVHIGTGSVLGAMAGITNDVADGSRMIGIPATDEREQKIKQAVLSKLPDLRRQVKKMQTAVNRLVEQSEQEKESERDDSPCPRAVA